MADKGKYNSSFTAADIRRYLKGEMPPQQMHELEKAALDDPFLREAMEGFELSIKHAGDAGLTKELEALSQALETRTVGSARAGTTGKAVINEKVGEAGKIVPATKWVWLKTAIAASILLVAGLFIYKTFIPGSGKDQLTVQQTRLPEPPPRDAVDPKQDAVDPKQKETKTTSGDTIPIARENIDPRSSRIDPPSSGIGHSSSLPEKEKSDPSSSLQEKEKSDRPSSLPEKDLPGRKTSPASPERILRGYAPLADKEEEIPAVGEIAESTAKAGLLKRQEVAEDFASKKRTAADTLQASTDKTNQFRSAQANRFASRTGRAKKASVADTLQAAAPVTGWPAFYQYIEKNKRKTGSDSRQPNEITNTESTLTGEVRLSFTVDTAGDLSAISVIRSLSPYYDAEAIRLIKSGPRWKLLKGKKQTVVLSLHF